MSIKKIVVLGLMILSHIVVMAQEVQSAASSVYGWGADYREVQIESSADGAVQKAIFRATTQSKPQPLIVCFHTWNADYRQRDPLGQEAVALDYNFIFPNLRGANNTPVACGSELMLADMDDAIRFAITNGNVNPDEVHIIGAFGGGYATLLAYMKVEFPVKSFNAWIPISDLEAWYWESLGRKQTYASDICKATQSGKSFDAAEARRRSPLYMEYPKNLRKNTYLNLYAGIHDGYVGAIPFTHSINMYNFIAREQGAPRSARVSEAEALRLMKNRINPQADPSQQLGDKQIHLRKRFNKTQLIIFEGGHDRLSEINISLLPISR